MPKELSLEDRVAQLTLAATTQSVILAELCNLITEMLARHAIFKKFGDEKDSKIGEIVDELSLLSRQLDASLGIDDDSTTVDDTQPSADYE